MGPQANLGQCPSATPLPRGPSSIFVAGAVDVHARPRQSAAMSSDDHACRLTRSGGPIGGWVLRAALCCALVGRAGFAAERFEFTRMVAHWSDYADPGYLSFIEEAKPEVVQVGFYGAHFWSLADTPFGGGYPAHLPARGHRQCAEWFSQLNA